MLAHSRIFLVSAVLVFMFYAITPATAQESGQPQKQPTDAQETPTVGDAELETAAVVYKDILSIHEAFQEKIQTVEDQDQRVKLQEEANKEMVAAVEKNGLNVETYNQIMSYVRANETVRKRFVESLESMQN